MSTNLYPCVWTLLLCMVAPAGATAQTVYFSAGKEILKLELTSAGTTLVHTSPMSVGDLALCAGNPNNPPEAGRQYLYFVEHDPAGGDRIGRLDVHTSLGKKASVNTSATTMFTVPVDDGPVGEIRLRENCDVLFATAAGIFQVSGAIQFATEATRVKNADGSDIVTTEGSGLAIAFDGSLRYSDDRAVKSTLAGFGTATVADPIVGLGVANAGAGSAAPALTALSVGPVCASTLNTVRCGPKPGEDLDTTLATFTVPRSSAVNNAQFFELLTNDTAIVATSVDPTQGLGGSAKFNGILWKVDASGVSELTRGLKINGLFAPIVGVAVAQSKSQATSLTTSPGYTHYLNFGPVAFDVMTPAPCNLSITLQQLSWAEAQAKLHPLNSAAGFNKYLLDPALGGESWVDDVDVRIASGTCDLSLIPARVGIAQFVDNGPTRAVLHCTANACEVATEGNFPYSTPDDERDSALPDNFSDFLTAIVASTANRLLFSTPLSNAAAVSGPIGSTQIEAATTHNAAGGLAIRFRICADAQCSQFLPGEQPDPPFNGAGLSVTRLDDHGVSLADCDVDDQGGANPDRPVFRVSDGGGTHVFNVNTPPDGPDACRLTDLSKGQRGLFVATVFSHSGRFTKTSILFWLQK